MNKVSHRSAEDLEWQKTKELVKKRDHNMCVACRVLTPKEYILFQRSMPGNTMQIDCAHIEPVGSHVEKTYDVNNVVCLCRAHHSRIDSFQDLVTGKNINKSAHEEWWRRIKEFVGIL